MGFDDAFVEHYSAFTLPHTNEDVWEGDWTLGNAGGYGEDVAPWPMNGGTDRMDQKTGAIAESWEIPEKGTIIFHIRAGIYWHNKPPTNGREVTANDVAFSINRHYTLSTGYGKKNYPELAAALQISTPDDRTVIFKCPPQYFGQLLNLFGYISIFPQDALEEFGDMKDWRNNIGTGAFIIDDFVPDTTTTFVRNPNYWRTNPIGPGKGDQLPYIDGFTYFIIEDPSTLLAAFRTGQIDMCSLGWEDAQEFINNPNHHYIKYFEDSPSFVVGMRTDNPDLPYCQKEVRQALMMAIDHQKILSELRGGKGVLLYWPLGPIPGYMNAYVPLEEQPQSVQELFGYHPDKAEELLDAAGYHRDSGTGIRFKTNILTLSSPAYVDPLVMVKAMWEKVGVELEIQPLEWASYSVRLWFRNYDHMIYTIYAGCGTYFFGANFAGPQPYNSSYIDDPVLNEAKDAMLAAYPDEAAVDAIHRALMPYLQEQCYVLQLPRGYVYRPWWPWLKNYSGESSMGFYNPDNFTKYVWIDQELKATMSY